METQKLTTAHVELRNLHLKDKDPILVNENGEMIQLIADQELMTALLLENFPGMHAYYEDIQQYWETDNPQLEYIMDDVVQPYLIKSLHDGNRETLIKLFNFFELMASSDDYRAKALLSIGICETLASFDDLYDLAIYYMKPETEKVYEIAKANLKD